MHFSAESTKSEFLFKIIFSANQLSIHGAVANWCYQFGMSEGEGPENASAQEDNFNKELMKKCGSRRSKLFGIDSKNGNSFAKPT